MLDELGVTRTQEPLLAVFFLSDIWTDVVTQAHVTEWKDSSFSRMSILGHERTLWFHNNVTNTSTLCDIACLSILWQICKTVTAQLEITSTSEGQECEEQNSAISQKSGCTICLPDVRTQRGSHPVIDDGRPDQAERACDPTHCKHSLMEGSNPASHMHGCRQTDTCSVRKYMCTHKDAQVQR